LQRLVVSGCFNYQEGEPGRPEILDFAELVG
jgi:hypothetical protein